MKRIVVFLGCVFMCFGCVTAQTSDYVPPAPYVANFEYSPPANETDKSVEVVFTVGKVEYKYAGKTAWLSTSQFANFEDAINADLPEILSSKGFTVRGPFDAYDLIPYSDKKAIDLYLSPVVTSEVIVPGERRPLDQLSVKVNIRIFLGLREIMTHELMWSKTLNFVALDVPFTSVVQAFSSESENGKIINVVFGYGKLEGVMAKEMEKQYPVVMGTIYTLIDPEEMAVIKNQTKDIKSKKGY
nr:hypothetical protein [uncultured bacterium]